MTYAIWYASPAGPMPPSRRARHGGRHAAHIRSANRRAEHLTWGMHPPNPLCPETPQGAATGIPQLRSGWQSDECSGRQRLPGVKRPRAKHGTDPSRGAVISCAAHRHARRARRGVTLRHFKSPEGRPSRKRECARGSRASACERRQGDAHVGRAARSAGTARPPTARSSSPRLLAPCRRGD